MSRTARYRYRIYPNEAQRRTLAQTFGCVRYVYNHILALRKEMKMNYAESDRRLTALKQDIEWLYDVSCVPLQQGLRDQQTAFKNFFDSRAQFPSFRKKSNRQTARYTRSAFSLMGGKLNLGRMPGLIKVKWSRDLPSDPSSVTVEQTPDGRYFASFVVIVNPEPQRARNKQCGVDMGINDVVARSDGYKSGKLDMSAEDAKLARLQRKMSRAKKGGKNRAKLRKKVARQYARIRDTRQDFLHKESLKIVRRHDFVAVEDLAIKNMVCNKRLSKAISYASWGELVRMIEYKLNWYGGTMVKIDRWYPSSKTCSSCGYEADSLPLSIRTWDCPECDATLDRDVNAAINILAVGQTVWAAKQPDASEEDTQSQLAPAA
jgi:putative transposase